jgi:hypothetical protein
LAGGGPRAPDSSPPELFEEFAGLHTVSVGPVSLASVTLALFFDEACADGDDPLLGLVVEALVEAETLALFEIALFWVGLVPVA